MGRTTARKALEHQVRVVAGKPLGLGHHSASVTVPAVQLCDRPQRGLKTELLFSPIWMPPDGHPTQPFAYRNRPSEPTSQYQQRVSDPVLVQFGKGSQ